MKFYKLYTFLVLLGIFFSCVSSGKGDSLAEKLAFFENDNDMEKVLQVVENYIAERGIDSLSPKEVLMYVNALILENRYDDALTHLNTLLEKYPENLDALYLMARLHKKQGNEKQALNVLNSILKLDSKHSGALYLRGELAFENKQYTGAAKLYVRSLEKDPNNVVTLVKLATTYEYLENINVALQYLKMAEAVNGSFSYVHRQKASLELQLQQIPEALSSLGKAIELDPDNQWNYIDRAMIETSYGNDKESAKRDVKKALELDPTNFKALVYDAGMTFEDYAFEEAKSKYLSLLEIKPEYYFSYQPLGELAFLKGDYVEAISYFEKALSYNTSDFYLSVMLAVSLKLIDNDKNARKIFSLVLGQFDETTVENAIAQYFNQSIGYITVNDLLVRVKNPYKRASFHYYIGLYNMIYPSESLTVEEEFQIAGVETGFSREAWMAAAMLQVKSDEI